jgi:murein DD-endopeptidase MepM/ murein hydrolase activator NlpD
MTTLRRHALLALVLLLVLGLAAPAQADSVSTARRRQAAAKAKRAQLAARVNAARASDRQLESAVRALDSHIATQQAGTDAARQAAHAADQALAAVQTRLVTTQRQVTELRAAVKNRAVAAYVTPSGSGISEVLDSHDLNEASRKREMLDQVVGGNRSDLERLRATEEDLVLAQQQLGSAQREAAARRRQAEARLVALKYARSQQDRLRSALDDRIKDYLAEADAVAKEEASLVAYIRTHSAPTRSSRGGDSGSVGRVSGAGLIWPVRGSVTSEYGSRWGRMHEGIDIGAGSGTPIHAAKAGTVVFSGTMNGYGNVIIVDHGGGFSTLYAHQSRRAAADGQEVGQGDVIGYVGSTGHSTGPHLHFETRVNGNPQNPRRYL